MAAQTQQKLKESQQLVKDQRSTNIEYIEENI